MAFPDLNPSPPGLVDGSDEINPVVGAPRHVAAAGARLPPGTSGDQAVDDDVDGERKPLIGIAGDHLGSVGGDERKPVGG